MKQPKLTKLELQIMEALWTRGACSIREIHETFPENKRPAYTTVQTTVYRMEGKKALHHYNYGSTQRGDDRGVEAFNECVHPVFRTHEDTGRKAVYVNRLMTVKVVDMDQAESDRLLSAVFDHAEKPEFVYSHTWRKGDLLLWDNRCSSHARNLSQIGAFAIKRIERRNSPNDTPLTTSMD